MTTHDMITALRPTPETFDQDWSTATLDGILADGSTSQRLAPRWRRTRRRSAVMVASGVVALTAGTAVAAGGPIDVVRGAILAFSNQPNTTGNGLGRLDDPELVAQFDTDRGVFAVWVATSSTGKVCYAISNGAWDGEGVPTKDELDYGCSGLIRGHDGQPEPFTRPDQLGGFFKDADGPLLYGVSPYPDAARVRVQGDGIDRTLPVRADSHGYGAALPEASGATAVTVTFVDDAGRELGSARWIAPVD